MKLLIIGGKGTIGKKVSAHFSKKHEIMIAGRNSGDVTGVFDLPSPNQVQDRPHMNKIQAKEILLERL